MHQQPAPLTIGDTAIESTIGSRKSNGALDVTASIVALFTLSIAQPLLDLLGRNAEFFVARDSSNSEVVVYACTLALIVPAFLGAITVLTGRVSPLAGNLMHALIFVSLGATLSLLVLQRTPLQELTGWVQAALAVAASSGLLALYRRSEALRRFTRWGVALPFITVGLFLFSSEVSGLVLGSPASAAIESVEVARPAPVVLLIFDALPISSLMDEEGDLQEDVYPNFARLAKDGTWYRNAITLHYRTERAVPAILSGLLTTRSQLPIAQDHPANLFTLLANHYDIRAEEPITRLCPEPACGSVPDATAPLLERWRGLVGDTRVIAGHLLLPVAFRDGLPPIDETWGEFEMAGGAAAGPSGAEDPHDFDFEDEWRAAAINEDRRLSIRRFIAGLDAPESKPTLHFLHALVPHSPWLLLPTGQYHDLPGGRLTSRFASEQGVWVDDPWRIDQVYQLHLLQVQYVDTVVGLVLDRLEELGTYDETLLIVLSDHGDSYRPGMPRQRGGEDTIEDILPVPLFIKTPNQDSGGIDDYRAQVTDVVPTIADILGISLPWTADGVSLESEHRPKRTSSEVETLDGMISFGTSGAEARARAQQKIDRFGSEGPFGLAPPGHADLLWRGVDSLHLGDPAQGEVILREPSRLRDVDLDADILPITVRGRINGADSQEDAIAIALNGQIVAVTRSYVNANGVTMFDALLPPSALRQGRNDMELIEITGTGSLRAFRPLG